MKRTRSHNRTVPFGVLRVFALIAMMGLLALESHGQLKRANRLFEQYHYAEAAQLYNQVLAKHPNSLEAVEKAAFCYRKLNQYSKAEVFYARAVGLPNGPSENLIRYGQALQLNGKLSEARQQFERYVEQEPANFIGRLLVRSIEHEEANKSLSPYEISLLEKVNSRFDDFGPVFHDGRLVFASERLHRQASGTAAKPQLSVYTTPFNSATMQPTGSIQPLLQELSGAYHDGPVTIRGDIIYFTRAGQHHSMAGASDHLKIYSGIINDNRLTAVVPFFLNSETYSVAHPALSANGRRLVFASDMPGGFGGMDLYVCKLEGGIWGQPINLGPVINTAGNEVYPAFQNNDVLFFASDGRHGMGGLDVYRTSVRNGKWQTSHNLGEPINSTHNDFGLAYVGEFSGIFSSDREGGKGGYELYRFRQRTDAQVIHLRGVYASDQPGNAPVALELVDINGKVVDRAKVDARGEFLFKRLSIDDHYLIRVPGADGPLPDDARIHFLDDLGRKVVLANRLDRSTFGFTALSRESLADLPKLDEVDETMLDRFALFGQVYRKLPGDPVKGLLVIARDREGNELERTFTDHEGKFSFRDLSADQFALVALEAEDEGLHLRLFDANNHVALEGKGNNGRFRFEQLAADENLLHRIYQPEDAELPQETVVASGIFEYRGKPAANVRINLLDRFRRIVQRTTTDDRGHFRFSQLHPEEHYLVMLDEQDKHIPEDARMYLIDEQGRETLLAERLKRGLFSFRTLGQDEQPRLAHEEENDASRAAFQVYGQVYEKLPGDFTTTMTVYALDDLGNIVETAQTLADGTFRFNDLDPHEHYLFSLQDDGAHLQIVLFDQEPALRAEDYRQRNGDIDYLKLGNVRHTIPALTATEANNVLIDNGNSSVGQPLELESVEQASTIQQDVLVKLEKVTDTTADYLIYYGVDTWDITDRASRELDKIARYLTDHPTLSLEITSHTDARGSNTQNLSLSERRTAAAVAYLQSSGIPPHRIQGFWFGEQRPVNQCADGIECGDEDHARNRRTEFRFTTNKKSK